jgi:uncharacterized protein (UPF0371 family)
MEKAFDNEIYLQEQTSCIRERMRTSKGRLYLEFGGKLLNDFHAARVLPGYDPNIKVRLLKELKKEADILLCIHAGAIEQRKIRADYGITYDADAMKLIDDLAERSLAVSAVVITRWEGQRQAKVFKTKLENRGLRVYTHAPISGYPADIDLIVSGEGYGANPRIEVSSPLVVVTGPGPGSGKMATCLSQVYHDYKRGVPAMYAKFETFPVWNLPFKHPVNIAYEAATLDLKDVNCIDPFHLEAAGESAINYNRDVESFPILKAILERITASRPIYRSPTEMGVNRVGFAIVNDDAARESAKQETVYRYFRTACEYMMGLADIESLNKAHMLLKELGITPEYRPVVTPARKTVEERAERLGAKGGVADGLTICGAALELSSGEMITGKNSHLLHAATAAIINGLKRLAGVPDSIHLLSPLIIESIAGFKREVGGGKHPSLDVDEALIALAISSALTPMVKACMDKLHEIRGCKMHLTHIPSPGDEAGLRRIGVNLTADPVYATKRIFQE